MHDYLKGHTENCDESNCLICKRARALSGLVDVLVGTARRLGGAYTAIMIGHNAGGSINESTVSWLLREAFAEIANRVSDIEAAIAKLDDAMNQTNGPTHEKEQKHNDQCHRWN